MVLTVGAADLRRAALGDNERRRRHVEHLAPLLRHRRRHHPQGVALVARLPARRTTAARALGTWQAGRRIAGRWPMAIAAVAAEPPLHLLDARGQGRDLRGLLLERGEDRVRAGGVEGVTRGARHARARTIPYCRGAE